ncbi:two-component system response regulator TorR [Sansalvadorimonas sp. 2012CJ34-2]|uniref:Two-component system response regulator TorR n=1 Tax=Parendozoicomonas callyspongiae TaxID=2942213 RepID=A0ABT0PEX3_9GAMM|nr:two-component system response regulator TorR [Sansalvadorimonas sp. 2012CJ34-2]MCL6269924.1 two-component system response regulator TorR [Sansalvadorimonas sp. 2012CJ34-2]
MSYHVLVVEDEPVTRARLSGYFRKEGYQVSEAEDGEQMMTIFQQENIDLVMLDINLPGEDGISLTRQLRSQSHVGIILVTGRTDMVDRVVGLEMGADDYVVKPFELRELLVRVKNLLWRISLAQQPVEDVQEEKEDYILQFDEWQLDTRRRELSRDGQQVTLTGGEYELLLAFTMNAGTVLSRERLLNSISHRRETRGDRTIDTLVRRLRHKLEEHPGQPTLLKTVHGEGYLFTEEVF